MSFVVGALIFGGIGLVLGYWYGEANRRWLDALARRGELPMGGTELLVSGWTRPRVALETLFEITRKSVFGTTSSPHPDVELWRIRRDRRWLLCIAWIVVGAPVALVVMVSMDAAGSFWWLLLLVPVIVLATLTGVVIRRYGDFEPS